MGSFHLVACVGKKLSHPAPARELYCSRWFHLVRTVVEQRGEPWAILSAEYNLVSPTSVIQPYDERMSTKSRDERVEWAAVICDVLPRADRYVIWGGLDYCEFLAPRLDAVLPLEGLGIGQQLSYLRKLVATPTLLDVARDALDLLIRCDADLLPDGTQPASDFEWDTVRFQLQKAIAAHSVAH